MTDKKSSAESASGCRTGGRVGSVNQDSRTGVDHASRCLSLGPAGNPPHSVLVQADLFQQHADLEDITGPKTTHGSRAHPWGVTWAVTWDSALRRGSELCCHYLDILTNF